MVGGSRHDAHAQGQLSVVGEVTAVAVRANFPGPRHHKHKEKGPLCLGCGCVTTSSAELIWQMCCSCWWGSGS